MFMGFAKFKHDLIFMIYLNLSPATHLTTLNQHSCFISSPIVAFNTFVESRPSSAVNVTDFYLNLAVITRIIHVWSEYSEWCIFALSAFDDWASEHILVLLHYNTMNTSCLGYCAHCNFPLSVSLSSGRSSSDNNEIVELGWLSRNGVVLRGGHRSNWDET